MDRAKKLAIKAMGRELDHGASILEVGFGDGSFLKALTADGYSVTGTEISEDMVAKARKENPSANVSAAGDLAGSGAKFDAVCCFEVLEHVEDPISLASQFPADTLYASVPNPGRWYPAITGRYEYWDFPPNHLWRYCACEPLGADHHDIGCKHRDGNQRDGQPKSMSIRWVLSRAGFEIVSIHKTAVDGHDLLRVIPIKQVSSDYDEMRPKTGVRRLASLAKTLLAPATVPVAWTLSLAGLGGVSYYIRAQRK